MSDAAPFRAGEKQLYFQKVKGRNAARSQACHKPPGVRGWLTGRCLSRKAA
jgi:hypothetical protein